MIDVVRDAEGVRMALEEIFEQDFVRGRIGASSEGADAESRERLEARIPPRTLSPGYYSFALHLLGLEAESKAGIVHSADRLADFEAAGLVALARARSGFRSRHPDCGSCGALQDGKFGVACHACGAKFNCKGA